MDRIPLTPEFVVEKLRERGIVLFDQVTVLVRGGGDLASGVIYRLAKAGFPIIVIELIRRW